MKTGGFPILARVLILLTSLWILPTFAAGARSRCVEFLGGQVNFVENGRGAYVFRDGRPLWIGDDGTHFRANYWTGSASHREILRRQVGGVKFAEIMASPDPEVAAQKAVRWRGDSEQQTKIRMNQILYDEPLPLDLVEEVFRGLQEEGVYATTAAEFLRINKKNIPKGAKTVALKWVEVTLITGTVPRFRDNESHQSERVRLYAFPYMAHGHIIHILHEYVDRDRLRFTLANAGENRDWGTIEVPVPD